MQESNTSKPKQYRQGDVLLVQIQEPIRGISKPDGVVMEGELTGHAHRVVGDGQVIVAYDRTYVIAGANTRLVHEEHGPIPLTQGTYRVVRQRQYVDETEAMYIQD